MAVAQFAGSIASFARIQEFLNSEPRQDKRNRPPEFIIVDEAQAANAKSSCQSSEVEKEKIQVLPKSKNSSGSSINQDAIVVNDGSFGWEAANPTLLSKVNLTFPLGRFSLLVGPVGCGKSTLLKGILGEVPYTDGTVHIAVSQIAYCEQSPWHMNGTVRESILAISSLDLTWYNTVIRACSLDEDLAQLPLGDRTQIGSKGVALSGGQRQRIALARAI